MKLKKGTKKHPVEVHKINRRLWNEEMLMRKMARTDQSFGTRKHGKNERKEIATLSGDFAENILTRKELNTLYLADGNCVKNRRVFVGGFIIGKECHLGCEIRHIVGGVLCREKIYKSSKAENKK